ncbi:MAG: hypothetical protein KAR40_06130 [Candidatus Sabulitectum sp.]|nr:hypothetical protein [Candidatus Sabulitectum sp.]
MGGPRSGVFVLLGFALRTGLGGRVTLDESCWHKDRMRIYGGLVKKLGGLSGMSWVVCLG